ncbi:hypothetical protein [Emcibacter sp.]|uniref:hypothetical protein n=1 Tax=Emcibacter sp. TaxID=1979954 RepID=UPI003A90F3EB
MSDFSLTGLFSPFSGADVASGYRNFYSHRRHSQTVSRPDREVDKLPVERRSFEINLSKVGRHHLRSDVSADKAENDGEKIRERDFHPFRNRRRRSGLAFFENFMQKMLKVFAIKILGDFLTALKGGASLDQLALDESKADIAEATENEESVVTKQETEAGEGTKNTPSLVSLSISVGFQIDITIGQQSVDGNLLSSQTIDAKNPVVVEQGTAADLLA